MSALELVVVGEMNPYGADPRFALYHLPRGASGDRLREIMGLGDAAYEALTKVNICAGSWSLPAAREKATNAILFGQGARIVLLGAKVRAAFFGPAPFATECRAGNKKTLAAWCWCFCCARRLEINLRKGDVREEQGFSCCWRHWKIDEAQPRPLHEAGEAATAKMTEIARLAIGFLRKVRAGEKVPHGVATFMKRADVAQLIVDLEAGR